MRIKLLHILWEGLGGAQRIVLELCRHLDLDKYDITVAILGRGGFVTDLIDSKKVRVLEFGCRTTTDIRSMRAVYAFLFSNKFEIIHNHEALFLHNLALMIVRHRSKLVYHEHGGSLLSGSLRLRIFYAIFARFYDIFIAIHKDMTQFMKCASKASAKKTVIIDNPVDINYFTPSKEPKRSFAGPQSHKTIGMVGRFVPQKDLALFFETARLIIRRRPNIQIVIVGDGPLWPRAKNASKDPAFMGRMSVLGATSEVPEVLRSLDLFLFTSRIEAFGMTLIESLACCVPVVGAQPEAGGARTLLEGLPGVLLVRERAPELLARATIALIEDPVLMRDMGLAGRAYVVANHSSTEWAKSIDSLYYRLLKRR